MILNELQTDTVSDQDTDVSYPNVKATLYKSHFLSLRHF